MTLRDDVLATAEAYATCGAGGDKAAVEYLVARGYSQLRAEVLTVFVTIAFARAVITKIPVTEPMILRDSAVIHDSGDGYEIRLLDVPEFVAAQDLAEETFETGVIPRAHFEASCFSAEFNLVNQMLHQGTDPSGAVFSQPRLLRLIDTPGFVDWYKNLTAGS